MELLREKLEKAIEKYGIDDKRVLKISKELNKVICEVQRSYEV